VTNHEHDRATLEERLAACQLEIERLREENRYLRRASSVFGQLAERLNVELHHERKRQDAGARRPMRQTSSSRSTFGGGCVA
jgi:FtsZ-binding cell division protein ZapB